MAQLNDTMVQGDLRVTGKIYGTDNAIRLENANLAIPPIGDGDYVGSSGDFFIGSGSGKNLPDTTNNFNIHTTVAHFSGTTYRLSQIATPTSSSNPTGLYERGGMSSDGITWTFGSWATYNNYTLPVAASGTRGGIQIGYSESGTNYAVKLSSEKAYVSVPWTDTKVTQTKDDSGTTAYPLLMAGATDPNGSATTSRYDSDVKLTPSTNTISANISGNAATASAVYPGSALETAINGKLDFAEKNFALSGSWNNQLDIAMLRILNSPDAGTSSSPEGGTMFALVGATEQHANGFVTQLAFGDDKLYYRTRHKPGTMWEWSDWKELAFKSEVNTLLALLATKQDIVKWTGLYVGDQSSPQYNPGVTKDYADKKASPDIVVYNDEMSTSAWTKYGPDGSVMDSGTFSGRFFFDELYRLSGASELIWIGPLNEISDNHYHHLHPCLGCSPKDSSFSSHYKPWTSWRKYKLTVHNTGGSAGTIKVQVGGRYNSIRYWSSSYTIVDGMSITHNATEFDTNDRYNYINLAVGAHTSKTFEFYFKRVERITPPTPTNLYYIERLIVTTK